MSDKASNHRVLLDETRKLLRQMRDDVFSGGALTGRSQRAGEDLIHRIDDALERCPHGYVISDDTHQCPKCGPVVTGETPAKQPLADMADAGAERLANYVRAFENLKTKSPKELVDLVLEHVIDLKPFHELLVEELCSRVYPGWENDDPPGTVKIGFDCYRCADKKMVVHNRLTGHLVPCPECSAPKTSCSTIEKQEPLT